MSLKKIYAAQQKEKKQEENTSEVKELKSIIAELQKRMKEQDSTIAELTERSVMKYNADVVKKELERLQWQCNRLQQEKEEIEEAAQRKIMAARSQAETNILKEYIWREREISSQEKKIAEQKKQIKEKKDIDMNVGVATFLTLQTLYHAITSMFFGKDLGGFFSAIFAILKSLVVAIWSLAVTMSENKILVMIALATFLMIAAAILVLGFWLIEYLLSHDRIVIPLIALVPAVWLCDYIHSIVSVNVMWIWLATSLVSCAYVAYKES